MYEKIRTILTFEERQAIERNLKLGYSASSISRRIGRSKNSIVWEVRRNGGMKNYNAEKAQLQSDIRNSERIQKIKKKNQDQKKPNAIWQRIENLEMQVEILVETIKELIHGTKN